MSILDFIERHPMRVDDAICLNAKHKDRHCARCLACPNSAIQQHGSIVQLESTRCDECGLCVAVCPTRVFTFEKWDQDAILHMLIPFSIIEFACPRKENACATRGRDVQAAMVVPCLAGLSPDLLIALASDHAVVWLDDSLCGSCVKSVAIGERIQSACIEANAFLAGWNRS